MEVNKAFNDVATNHTLSNHVGVSSEKIDQIERGNSEKSSVDKERVENMILVLPHLRDLEDVLDNFYFNLHEDKKLPQFSRLFSQVLRNNPQVFRDLGNEQKAQILFDGYKEWSLSKLKKSKEYQTAFQALAEKIQEGTKEIPLTNKVVTDTVDRVFKNRINNFHSSFLVFAIAPVVGLDITQMKFSYEFTPVKLDYSGIDFSIS